MSTTTECLEHINQVHFETTPVQLISHVELSEAFLPLTLNTMYHVSAIIRHYHCEKHVDDNALWEQPFCVCTHIVVETIEMLESLRERLDDQCCSLSSTRIHVYEIG